MDWEERNFRKVDGGHAFFPYGPLSRGYIVDDAKKAELIVFIKRLDRSLAVVLIAAAAGWWISGSDGMWMGVALVVLPLTVYYELTIRRMLAGVPRTDNRRTLSEQLRATADVMPSFAIYLVLIGGFDSWRHFFHLSKHQRRRSPWPAVVRLGLSNIHPFFAVNSSPVATQTFASEPQRSPGELVYLHAWPLEPGPLSALSGQCAVPRLADPGATPVAFRYGSEPPSAGSRATRRRNYCRRRSNASTLVWKRPYRFRRKTLRQVVALLVRRRCVSRILRSNRMGTVATLGMARLVVGPLGTRC
jgi:hypothetical protein